MHNVLSPTAMTPRQRLREVADILAQGFLRQRGIEPTACAKTHTSPIHHREGLTEWPQESGHAVEPVRRRR